MTIREIRNILFYTDMFVVIGPEEMTNEDAMFWLYLENDQERVLNVIENGDHLLIWEV